MKSDMARRWGGVTDHPEMQKGVGRVRLLFLNAVKLEPKWVQSSTWQTLLIDWGGATATQKFIATKT